MTRAALVVALVLTARGATARAEDIVEEIDLGDEEEGPTPRPAPKPAPPAEPSPNKLLLRGWAKSAGALGMRNQGDDEDPEAARLHYDKFVGTETLFLGLGFARGDHIEAGLSATLTALWALAEPRPAVVEGDDVGENRADLEPRLRDAYLGVLRPHLLVRAGQQRVVWGTSDAYKPNDVLNARDLRDRTQTEAEIVELPTPSLRVDWEPAVGAMVQLVAGPFVPDEFDVYGTNWALVQRSLPPLFRAVMRTSPDPLFLSETDPPSKIDARDWTFGWAMKLRPASADVNVYYHYGYDRTPRYHTDPQLQQAVAMMPVDELDAEAIQAAVEEVRAAGREPAGSEYVRRHHVGFDVTTTRGAFVFRQDVALDTKMVFLQRNLDGVARPALQGVAGIEYQTGQIGKVVLVELHHLQILDPPPDDSLLLMRSANTSLAGTVRWRWDNHLLVDAQVAQGIRPTSTSLRPEVGWQKDRFDVRLGLLLLHGEARTYGSYFTESSSAYATIKYVY